MSLLSTSGAALQARENPFPGLIIRERDPENLEFPFYALNSSLTPNDQFFVRSHFPVPKIDINSWSLKVEGLVEHPLDLSFDQLSALPTRTATIVMECAGNSRIFLSPKVGGLQSEMGAVGNAEWTGVPLADILQQAGTKPDSDEVLVEGVDRGEITTGPVVPGETEYTRASPGG